MTLNKKFKVTFAGRLTLQYSGWPVIKVFIRDFLPRYIPVVQYERLKHTLNVRVKEEPHREAPTVPGVTLTLQ